MTELYIRRPAAPSDALTTDLDVFLHVVVDDSGRLLEMVGGRLMDTPAMHDPVVISECRRQAEAFLRAAKKVEKQLV